jgi:hypothetical protein
LVRSRRGGAVVINSSQWKQLSRLETGVLGNTTVEACEAEYKNGGSSNGAEEETTTTSPATSTPTTPTNNNNGGHRRTPSQSGSGKRRHRKGSSRGQ